MKTYPVRVPSRASGSFVSTQRALSRRQFLRGAGIVLTLPFLDSMLPAFAKAETKDKIAVKPRRMLAVCNNLGLLPDQFFPRQTGRGYALSPYLEHLREHRDDFSVF